MSYGKEPDQACAQSNKTSDPRYYPEIDEPVRKNNFNKKINRSSQKFEVLDGTLELIHKKLLLSCRNDENTKQDAIDEFERFIKYCEDYKNELKSAINNDIMEDVVK